MLNPDTYKSSFYDLGLPSFLCTVPDLRIVDANHSAVETFGYDLLQLNQLTLPELCVDNYIAHFRDALVAHGKIDAAAVPPVVRFLKKDGTMAHVNPKVSFYQDNGEGYLVLAAIDISEEIKTRHQLSLANERLRTAQKVALLGYWSNNLQTGEITWSDELNDIFELNKQQFEVSLPDIIALFEEEERVIFEQSLGELFRSGNSIELEQRIITTTGKQRWIFQRLRILKDDEGRPLMLEGVTQDITERKHAELQLVKRNKMLSCINQFTSTMLHSDDWYTATSALFQSIQDIFQVDSVCYFENDEKEDLEEKCATCKVRWRQEHTLGQDIQYIPLRYIEDAVKVMKSGQPFTTDTARPGDSKIKNTLREMGIRSVMMLPTITNGYFYGFMCLHNYTAGREWDDDERDFLNTVIANLNAIFEKKRYKNTATTSSIRLASLISNMPGIVMRTKVNDDFTITFISHGVEEMTGYPAQHFMGSSVRNWGGIIHPDDQQIEVEALQGILPGQSYNITYRVICRDGSIKWLSSKARAEHSADDDIFIDAVIIDITSLILQTETISNQNDALKNIAWTQSHVVRAPLTNVMALTDLLGLEDGLSDDIKELLLNLKYAAGQLDTIIKDIVAESNTILDPQRRARLLSAK